MARMSGKVCLVTGATAGIGLETARGLARAGARVVLVGRSKEKTQAVLQEIIQATGNDQVESLLGDLSVQSEVRRVAAEFRSRYDRLDLLVNNAGGIFGPRQVTGDGLELTFALNHLGYFLLTNLLLDMLRPSTSARVVNLSSAAHKMGRIDFDDLQSERRYGAMQAYADSKLANILFTYELARKLEGSGVTVNCLHPGVVRTNFGGTWSLMSIFYRLGSKLMLNAEQGADTVLYLATSPEVEGVSGKYFVKRKPVASSKASYDQAVAARLWQVSAQMTGTGAS